jgi:hypothetical protein
MGVEEAIKDTEEAMETHTEETGEGMEVIGAIEVTEGAMEEETEADIGEIGEAIEAAINRGTEGAIIMEGIGITDTE